MAMDWSDERWVKVYTRDTASWKLLGWQARTVLLHMFRKVDRAGVIDDGGEGSDGLAAALDLPPDVTCHGLSQLVTRGIVVSRGDQHVIPNFLAAQSATSSDAERQRKSRETRRASVTIRDGESQNVTERHAVSRGVTSGHSESRVDESRLDEPERESGSGPATPAALPLFGDRPDPTPAPKPDPVATLWAEQERLRADVIPGCRGLDLTTDRRKRIAALLGAGHTVESLTACVRAYAAEVKRDAATGQWFNGDSNWRPDNVARTLGRIGAKSPPVNGQAAPTPMRRKFL